MTEQHEPKPDGGADKDAAAVLIFPPAIPVLTVIAGAMLMRQWPIGADLMLQSPLRKWIGGAIILGAFYFLGFRAVAAMRRTGQTENPYKTTTEIVQIGPFGVTRNPMYLQMVLICIGFGVSLANVWILLLTPLCALALHYLVILPEETYLEDKFGAAYTDYKQRVRRWI